MLGGYLRSRGGHGRNRTFRGWSTRPLASKIIAYYFFGFALLWTTFSFVVTWREYSRLYNAIVTGHARLVEGVVTDFSPMPVTGHAMERFCVSDSSACFEYSDYVVTSGFNNSSSHGGPIRAGLRVRVTYIGNSPQTGDRHAVIAQTWPFPLSTRRSLPGRHAWS